MRRLCQFLLFLVVICGLNAVHVNVTREHNRCLWMGQCTKNAITGGMYNCYNNTIAPNVTEGTELFDLLEEVCPWYINQENKNWTRACCDVGQVRTLQTQVTVAQQLFSRCPACFSNFMKHFCTTTCDPDESLFMDPGPGHVLNDTETGKLYIQQVDVYLTDKYANTMFDSCKNVEYPEDSSKVINLMCGGTDNCTAHLWLQFLGSPTENNNEAPFLMNYKFEEPGILNMSARDVNDTDFIPCNSSDSKYQCSCSDCPATCPPIPKYSVHEFPWWKASVGASCGLAFVSLLLFLLACLQGLCSTISARRKQVDQDAKSSFENNIRPSYGAVPQEQTATSATSSQSRAKNTTPKDDPFYFICFPLAKVGAHLERNIKVVFYHWGKFASKYWFLVLLFATFITCGLMFGLFFFDVVTDPVQLWSAPNSRARTEKNYFDEHFGPFYRTEQIIIKTNKNVSNYSFPAYPNEKIWNFGAVFQLEVLEEVLNLQNELATMKVPYNDEKGSLTNITLKDICFAPLAPDNNECTITSVLNYFQNNVTRLKYQKKAGFFLQGNASYHIHVCTRNPTSVMDTTVGFPCLGTFGGYIDPNVALGGFDDSGPLPNYDTAEALIVTFIVNNHVNDEDNKMAKVWEAEFIKRLKAYEPKYIEISFSSERSITDELNRESRTDVVTILVSYCLMFAYITIFLGQFRSISTILVDTKLMVGFVGVMMVLVAVLTSLGFYSYIGVKASLIVLEVVPFLVLAVGVDNLFILVHSYDRQLHKDNKAQSLSTQELMGRALGDVAPSLLLTSLSETAAFLLGAISTMPAVRTFSLYAGTAVFVNFLLQITVVVSVMALDANRQRQNRMDVFFCVRFEKPGDQLDRDRRGPLRVFMDGFASVILYKWIKPFVILFFGLLYAAAIGLMFQLNVGLDQTVALPKDSYLMPYFSELNEYLHTGAPVYFVIKEDFNYSIPGNQDKICSGAGCNNDSLGIQLSIAAQIPQYTRIAEPASIWLDSYFEWMDPVSKCCGIDDHGDECHDPGNSTCNQCLAKGETRPTEEEFPLYLNWFLNDNPNTKCAAGGHAAFKAGVPLSNDKKHVNASYMMTYHTILKNSSDYIDGLYHAREIGDSLTETLGHTVFPYSVWYVYYEQYLSTAKDMALNIGVSWAAVFVVSLLLLGMNVWAALVVAFIIQMIIVDMMGFMHLCEVNANAVSLVNLVMTVGISVEFCSHILRWFCSCDRPTRQERAKEALSEMGASVFSGITLTKFIGVFVLLFSKSQIFEVYYFRMYMLMLLFGFLHGLVLLPVLLSYVGPPYYHVQTKSPWKLDGQEVVDRSPSSQQNRDVDRKAQDYDDDHGIDDETEKLIQ